MFVFFFFTRNIITGITRNIIMGITLNIYIEENFKNKRENSNPQKRNCQTEMVHC